MRVCVLAAIVLAIAGCSGGGDSTGNDLPVTDVAYPGGFPVTGTTDVSVVTWYRVTGLSDGAAFTATVAATTTTAEDAVFVDVVESNDHPEDSLCPSFAEPSCTWNATGTEEYLMVMNGFTPVGQEPQPVGYSLTVAP